MMRWCRDHSDVLLLLLLLLLLLAYDGLRPFKVAAGISIQAHGVQQAASVRVKHLEPLPLQAENQQQQQRKQQRKQQRQQQQQVEPAQWRRAQRPWPHSLPPRRP